MVRFYPYAIMEAWKNNSIIVFVKLNQTVVDTKHSKRSTKLTLLLLNMACHVLVNSADPDQLASEEAN